jgi:hypothetical protein
VSWAVRAARDALLLLKTEKAVLKRLLQRVGWLLLVLLLWNAVGAWWAVAAFAVGVVRAAVDLGLEELWDNMAGASLGTPFPRFAFFSPLSR